MIPFAWILLAAAASHVSLVDEVYQVPAGEWKYIELDQKQVPVTVLCRYSVQSGSPDLRLALMRRAEIEKLREDHPHGVLSFTPPGAMGRMNHTLSEPGEYAVVLDNRNARRPAQVRLAVSLAFGARGPTVTYVPRERQLTVIVLSFAMFFGIVIWSGRRLMRAVRR
jgi:hypothetical protein